MITDIEIVALTIIASAITATLTFVVVREYIERDSRSLKLPSLSKLSPGETNRRRYARLRKQIDALAGTWGNIYGIEAEYTGTSFATTLLLYCRTRYRDGEEAWCFTGMDEDSMIAKIEHGSFEKLEAILKEKAAEASAGNDVAHGREDELLAALDKQVGAS